MAGGVGAGDRQSRLDWSRAREILQLSATLQAPKLAQHIASSDQPHQPSMQSSSIVEPRHWRIICGSPNSFEQHTGDTRLLHNLFRDAMRSRGIATKGWGGPSVRVIPMTTPSRVEQAAFLSGAAPAGSRELLRDGIDIVWGAYDDYVDPNEEAPELLWVQHSAWDHSEGYGRVVDHVKRELEGWRRRTRSGMLCLVAIDIPMTPHSADDGALDGATWLEEWRAVQSIKDLMGIDSRNARSGGVDEQGPQSPLEKPCLKRALGARAGGGVATVVFWTQI